MLRKAAPDPNDVHSVLYLSPDPDSCQGDTYFCAVNSFKEKMSTNSSHGRFAFLNLQDSSQVLLSLFIHY